MATLTVQEAMDQGLKAHQAGNLAEAEALYQQVLDQNPDHASALHLLGVVAYQGGKYQVALDAIQRAIAINPNVAEFHRNLGLALASTGKLQEAVESYHRALALRPNYPRALFNMSCILRQLGKLDEAMGACRKALALNPKYPEALNAFGAMWFAKGNAERAMNFYKAAIAQQPIFPQAYFNLGFVYQQQDQTDNAIAAYRKAIECRANYPEAYTNLGVVLKLSGQLDRAIEAYQKAIDLLPHNTTAHSNLVYLLEFHAGQTQQSICEAQKAWAKQHAAPLRPMILPHENDPSPDRRIRVGYFSPDLRNHVVGTNLLPLLREHNHEDFEVFCYSSSEHSDAMSKRLGSFADCWRDVSKLDDAAAQKLIREDKIDILVDLTLHMANNRLRLFARKPAPVQVTYLGYCGGTGLDTIDYRLSDPQMDPLDSDTSFFSEETIRLPKCFWCYQQPDPSPRAAPPPMLKKGHITFGCMNNFAKVTPAAQDLFARVMLAVPGSKLILHSPKSSYLDVVRQRFAAAGISGDRIEFVGKQAFPVYLQTYNRIDIALDPIPYGGGITTCDGLWMGAPTVTLSGQTPVSRGGRTIMFNIGFPEWIAYSEDDYVKIAADLASDHKRLEKLRFTMRERMYGSPLMDAKRFARDVEAAFREMWKRWCAGKVSESPHASAAV